MPTSHSRLLFWATLYIDSDTSKKTHVSQTVSSCSASLRHIRSIRRSVSKPETKRLIVYAALDLAQPRLSCILVTISAVCSTSNVVLFTADCKTIMLVYHLVSSIQDGSRNPEVQITIL